MPEFSSSENMNVSSVIVPPKVPPRRRRGSDSPSGSPRTSSPLKKRQTTLGGYGIKPGSPKVEALKNDPFQPISQGPGPPRPPPRGRFLKKGGQTQSCLDVLESTRKPIASTNSSNDDLSTSNISKDDMFMSAKNGNDNSLSKISSSNGNNKRHNNFFVLEPNSSSLMTNVITEKTQAVSKDILQSEKSAPLRKDSIDETQIKHIPSTHHHDEGNKKIDSKPSQGKHEPLKNNSSMDASCIINNKVDSAMIPSQNQTISKDEKKIPMDSEIIVSQANKNELKENGCLETNKIIPDKKNSENKNDKPSIKIDKVEKAVVKSDKSDNDSKTVCNRIKNDTDTDTIKEKVHEGKNKEEKIAEDKEESTISKQTKIQVPTQSKLGDSKNKIGVPQSKTRSTSNNELKTAEKGATSQPSKKQGGMFDVVGNFSAISDALPSVSSVTKSLTNASTNIDIIGASKLSKVVKFDMSSKVKFR